MTSTPQEVFTHHWDTLVAGDVPAVMEDYTDDAVLITADNVFEGKDAISGFFSGALAALPDAKWAQNSTAYAGDALLLHWNATSPQGRIDDGVDTFVFVDGKIRLQTVSFTLTPA
ncbi:nuclear transport factor 2 family protein [Geodermatophilus sp. SYSU D00691]